MGPFDLDAALGPLGAHAVYLAIGLAFGIVLEMAGFGDSRKLAGQFYLREMTVLKVMFTAIVTAMLLIFLASSLGFLDYDRIWVNPTYLWPGIVGGLVMGVGFIIGGFCPGTSLVAVATAKLDGIFFTLGVLVGIFLFGETVDLYPAFYNGSSMGRFTVPEWLGLETGAVVLLVALMALGMFWGAERLERIFGGAGRPTPPRRLRRLGAGALTALAIVVLLLGQPTVEQRWERIAPTEGARLQARQVQIHPAELATLMRDDRLNLVLLDLRDEADYNLFHLSDARRVDAGGLTSLRAEFAAEPPNTAVVLVSNDEQRSTEAWKRLAAERVPNVYLLEGGMNHWLDVFGHEEHEHCPSYAVQATETLRHGFTAARGSRDPAAAPDIPGFDPRFVYLPKVEISAAGSQKAGGCG